jgi:hypothetical protein
VIADSQPAPPTALNGADSRGKCRYKYTQQDGVLGSIHLVKPGIQYNMMVKRVAAAAALKRPQARWNST